MKPRWSARGSFGLGVMDDAGDFEGSLVLEQLARCGAVEAFLEAVDSDDARAARRLMRAAGVDSVSIAEVLACMADPDDPG